MCIRDRSYTSFAIRNCCGRLEKAEDGTQIVVEASVTNVGKLAGKEVVQLYYSAPQGRLGKPARALGAFAKTRCLQPGETQQVTPVSYTHLRISTKAICWEKKRSRC